MKCLIVHSHCQKRGVEDSLSGTESSLLSSGGHDVQDYTFHNDALTEESKITLTVDSLWNRDIYQKMKERIRDFKPDIVHFHNIFPIISPAVFDAAKDAGAAVVISLHNYRSFCPSSDLYRDGNICEECRDHTVGWPSMVYGCYGAGGGPSGAVAAMLAVHRMAGSFDGLVDKYIAFNQHSRSLFIRAGLPADRVVVKPNFVVQPPPAVGDRESFALFAGRLIPEKGISTLLKAWRDPAAPSVPLMVVGEGAHASEVEAAGENVHLLGAKTRSEIHALMRRAGLFIFPSERCEPFGLKIVEAFANELPVLAAGVGVAQELIEVGRTGFLFEAGNPHLLARAARYALECPEALNRMGLAAELEYRLKYTPARNLRLLEAIYHDAMDDRRLARVSAGALGRAEPHPV